MDPQLWAWVDRVIYDSQTWSDFGAQMQRVETAQADAKQRIVLCDLNWTRLVQFRLAHRAVLRSSPASHRRFEEIENVGDRFRAWSIARPRCSSAGWLAAQLQLDARGKDEGQCAGFSRRGREDDRGFIAGKGGRTDQPLRG